MSENLKLKMSSQIQHNMQSHSRHAGYHCAFEFLKPLSILDLLSSALQLFIDGCACAGEAKVLGS